MGVTLVIMAAGLGTRFGGGIKQLTKMSDGGEIIMDYSIFDAKEAGFDKVIFIIRKDIEKDFQEVIGNRIEKQVDVEYVFQSIDDLPEGFGVPEGRTKPWGTGQAVLCVKDKVDGPFVIINADDYYGKSAYKSLYQFLISHSEQKDKHTMVMPGFVIENTLSENGTVTRGICEVDENAKLQKVMETKFVELKGEKVVGQYNGQSVEHDPTELCSMNMWGAYPEFLDTLEKGFKEFLESEGDPQTKEFLVPLFVNKLLQEQKVDVTVIPTQDKWIGITYKDDIDLAKQEFKALIDKGIYKKVLWD